MFQDVVHMFQDVELKFQDVEDKKVLGRKTFFPKVGAISFLVLRAYLILLEEKSAECFSESELFCNFAAFY